MVAIISKLTDGFRTKLRDGFRSWVGWDEACHEGGPPVHAVHKCDSGCCPSHPVTTLQVGAAGVVSCLTDPDHPRAARLASLGILPGVPVRLVQAYPAWVLRVGFAEIALDGDMARLVRVITGAEPRTLEG
jgi:Fe2+ transport system protein FeoA